MSGATGSWDYDPNIPTPLGDDVTGLPQVMGNEPAPSALTVDYYRQKVVEFQKVLDALDVTAVQLWESGAVAYASGNDEMIAEYEALQSSFENKRNTFVTVAEGIQFASRGINAAGLNFPTVQIPMGLGALPLVPLAAAGAVIAAAAALIVWAREFWRAVREFGARWQHMNAIHMLPEGERATALEQLRKLEISAQIAEQTASQSPLNAAANLAKWAAVGVGLFMVWKMMQSNRGA